MNAYYFSTHGGAGPAFPSLDLEVEGFFISPGPNLPVFKNACIFIIFYIIFKLKHWNNWNFSLNFIQ